MQNQERDKVLGGIEMAKIFAISRILLKKRQVDSTTHLHFKCNFLMTMMKFI